MASGVTSPYFDLRSLSSEPEFMPILIGIFLSPALSTTSFSLLFDPKVPGLILRPSTPASIEAMARRGSKWISATSGRLTFFLISLMASASSISGTASRTSWQPAFSNLLICLTVGSIRAVLVLVIDWTTIWRPPPISTWPILISFVFRRGKRGSFISIVYRYILPFI